MSLNIYVTGASPGSGKSLIVLGMMELLTAHVEKVGLFRPIIASDHEPDPNIHLAKARYGLEFPDDSLYGCTDETALELVAAGRQDELLKLILDKFKALESQCDAVLCSGTDYASVSAALEFDFNVELANNLGCLLVPVINGRRRNSRRLADATSALLESLEERGSDVLVMVVNRVAAGRPGELPCVKWLDLSISSCYTISIICKSWKVM